MITVTNNSSIVLGQLKQGDEVEVYEKRLLKFNDPTRFVESINRYRIKFNNGFGWVSDRSRLVSDEYEIAIEV